MAEWEDSIIGTVAGVEQKDGKAKFKLQTDSGQRTVTAWITKKDGNTTQAYGALIQCVERPNQVVCVNGDYYHGEYQGKPYKSFTAKFVELLDERPPQAAAPLDGGGESRNHTTPPREGKSGARPYDPDGATKGLAFKTAFFIKANEMSFKNGSEEQKLAELPLQERCRVLFGLAKEAFEDPEVAEAREAIAEAFPEEVPF